MNEAISRKRTEEQKAIEVKRLKAMVTAIVPSEVDKIDIYALYDSTLNYMENKQRIIEEVKALYPQEFREATLKNHAEHVKSVQEGMNVERDEKIEREILEYNKREYVENRELDQFYGNIHRTVDKMCKGFSNLAFIKGRGAVGKSWNIRKVLLKNGVKFHEIAGDVTEAYLYRLFFEHNGEIIWFKDVVRILRGMTSINLLKAATETEAERLLTKSNYSKAQDDLPDRFIYRGKIIFDYNEVTGIELKDDFEALQTRGDYVDAAYSIDDIKAIMKLIAAEGWQKEVTNYLIENYEFTGQNLLNLRTQWKAFKTYDYCQQNSLVWRDELKQELAASVSKVRGLLYSLIGTKAVRTAELKKLLMKYQLVNTMRTADRKVNDWILTEELIKVSAEDKNFFVCLVSIKLK